MNRTILLVVLSLIRMYKLVLSPLLPPACRYMPTCSDYFSEALGKHGFRRGAGLTMKRLSKCHPFGSRGYDPVP